MNYRSFTLLHRIYSHIHWVFLICLVLVWFLLCDWFKILQKLLQRPTHVSMLLFIFTSQICDIVAVRQRLNYHIRMLLSFAKLKKPCFTHKDVSAKILKSALIPQCKTFWFNTAAKEILKMSVGVTKTFIIAIE